MKNENLLAAFHPIVRTWFETTFGTPSRPQQLGWQPISEGRHTLIVAPTGSGKTLAAFLWCINHLVEESLSQPPLGFSISPPRQGRGVRKTEGVKHGVRVLYISPLKALNNDIHRNLEEPLEGIHNQAAAQGFSFPKIRSAVRTGDTTQQERQAILKSPPDILITTPESLYLMLSSPKARHVLATVQYVIVDEIHSISSNKRGVHLSLSLERLQHFAMQEFVRIGLSATQKPLEDIAHFLCGQKHEHGNFSPRNVTIVNAGYTKKMELHVRCLPTDFSNVESESVWTLVYPELLKEISRHRTTLIFVNNRRLAERIAAKLNEILSGQSDTFNNYTVPFGKINSDARSTTTNMLVQAYHSSMSRAAREQMETDLKAGSLRVLVATSSLELGIDIGSVELVIQLQSPKGIARGLQRVGRSGHRVNEISKGTIFPTHRDDLLECAVVANEMSTYNIEPTHIPENCLDVLAQHIVSIASVDEWNSNELFALVQHSYCYRTLTKKLFLHTIEMLAGRYSNGLFRELRARIAYDKINNTLSALPGSSHLAIANAGTIPDRGYYAVYLGAQKIKIGEVDEEFIYESRVGDTFILGSHVWRMSEINANNIVVEPAPGQPARMPFWRGEGIGRSYELGVKIGELLETLSGQNTNEQDHALKEDNALSLLHNFPIDSNSARNIVEYIAEQKNTTRIVPTHRAIVVEGFRDEIGDPRIVVHSCFGRGVNGLLGLVVKHRLTQLLKIDIQMLYNDNGILFRCSDVERLPLDLFSSLTLSNTEEIILEELPSSPLFGALFRQNAARALLLPKAMPGKRTPLWLQRLRAGDLLQIVKQFNDFPIVIETMRDCLYDALDFKHFKEVMSSIATNDITVYTAYNETPSPFASSMLFEFISIYMYASDKPKNSGAQQQSFINKEMLGEVVELNTIKNIIKEDAITRIEEQLQCTASTRQARTPEELLDIFVRLGELTPEETAARSLSNNFISSLIENHSVVSIHIRQQKYYIAAEDIPLYVSFSEIQNEILQSAPEELQQILYSQEDALRFLILRLLRSHTLLNVETIAQRYAISHQHCAEILSHLQTDDDVVSGNFIDGESAIQYAYRPNIERLHRASISILRKEIQTATLPDFTNFLLQWQHVNSQSQNSSADTELHSIIEQMNALMLPQEIWEGEIFRRRIHNYQPQILRMLASRGDVVSIGHNGGKISWLFRGEENIFLNNVTDETLASLSKSAHEIYLLLQQRGALFLSDMREVSHLSLAALNKAIAELFWNSLITNDVVDEVLHVKRYKTTSGDDELLSERIELMRPRKNPLRFRAMRSVRSALRNTPGWNGRWSLLHQTHIAGNVISMEEKAFAQAQQLLVRYGIVAREIAKRETNLLPWSLLAMQLQKMEMRGEIRRGYFVNGLSGMQFALPEASELLRSVQREKLRNENTILNACDPANPYGAGIESVIRINRSPQNYLVLANGSPIMWMEQFGAKIFTIENASEENIRRGIQQFVDHLRAIKRGERNEIIIEYCNELRPVVSPLYETLRAIGFYRDKSQTMRLDL